MSFQLAHLDGGGMPRTLEKAVAAAQAFEGGALLLMDANGQWAECGADPAAVAAVSITAYGPDTSGFIRTGKKEFPPGYMQGISVANEKRFSAEYVGTLPAADGGSYGVVRDTDGRWKVDFAEVTALRIKLVNRNWTEAPINKNRVIVVFLQAVVQVV